GVLQLARDAKEEASQRKALAALCLPPGYAQYATREEASAHAGVPLPASGIWFPRGGWLQPRSLIEAQLAACGERLERRFSSDLENLPPEKPVILANSFDAPKLHPVPHLRLRRVRGQLTYVQAGEIEPPHVVVLRGGMVLPPVDGLCVVGATYDIDDEDPSPRRESHEDNLSRMANIIPSPGKFNSMEGRVAFRAVAPDRVPVVGKLADGVYGAFAYGSRGIIWAALAAELIAAELEGEPLPLEGKLADAMDPGRFARRARLRQP
ncbi:MAG TPA: FAD-dependent oxidoreductase, partial [Burkholderiales bacterium]